MKDGEIKIDAHDFTAGAVAAMAIVAALIETLDLDTAQRDAIASAAAAKLAAADPGLPTNGDIRNRALELIGSIR